MRLAALQSYQQSEETNTSNPDDATHTQTTDTLDEDEVTQRGVGDSTPESEGLSKELMKEPSLHSQEPSTVGLEDQAHEQSLDNDEQHGTPNKEIKQEGTKGGAGIVCYLTTGEDSNQQDPTHDGSNGLGGLDGLNAGSLLELQNTLLEFNGVEAVNHLLNDTSNQATSNTNTNEPISLSTGIATTDVNTTSAQAHPKTVNVEEEDVFMNIGKLIGANTDLSSLSQDTQEQLTWLVNQFNNCQQPQDDFGNEADEGDDDRSRSMSTPDLPVTRHGDFNPMPSLIGRSLEHTSAKRMAEQARIREENRERKKRWRESNQDRSKLMFTLQVAHPGFISMIRTKICLYSYSFLPRSPNIYLKNTRQGQ